MRLTSAPAPRGTGDTRPDPRLRAFWASAPGQLLVALGSSSQGLSGTEATARLAEIGPNTLDTYNVRSRSTVLTAQIKSPLLLLLLFAAAASALSGEFIDAIIVTVIVLATVTLGFWREYRAETATAALQAQIRTHATALRDGVASTVPIDEIVPGDVVLLAAGSLVPGDGVLLEASDFYVNESVVTGESFPVAKYPGVVETDAAIGGRTNAIFLGTNVRSGTARGIIVHTGVATEFGHVAARLAAKSPVTDFERGIRRFGYMLTVAMLSLVIVLFAAHVLRGRSPAATLLFSIALAVGLSPELLPAILTINLSRGAQMLARRGVLVRRLSAIENLGSMDVLCTDKTGTLTEGLVHLEGAYGPTGERDDEVLALAALNSTLQTDLSNALDDAIRAVRTVDPAAIRKIAEIPFDFLRKRVSVVVASDDAAMLVTKGAFPAVLEACTTLQDGRPLSGALRHLVRQRGPGAGRRTPHAAGARALWMRRRAGTRVRRVPHVCRSAQGARQRGAGGSCTHGCVHQDHLRRQQRGRAVHRGARRAAAYAARQRP
jgi:Mg2+-importing ATPase